MRIACPTCNAAYDVPPAQLAPGRTVRCARCTNTWTPVETEDAAPAIAFLPEASRPPPTPPRLAEPPSIEPQPGHPQPVTIPPPPFVFPMPDPAPPPASTATIAAMKARLRRRRPPVLVGWLVTLVVLAELVYLVDAYPGPVIRFWPAAARAYAAFGIQPPPATPP